MEVLAQYSEHLKDSNTSNLHNDDQHDSVRNITAGDEIMDSTTFGSAQEDEVEEEQKPKPSLQTLPAELRNQIALDALSSSEPLKLGSKQYRKAKALIETSSQLRSEGRKTFFHNNDFYITLRGNPSSRIALLHFLTSIGPEALGEIQSLEIQLEGQTTESIEQDIEFLRLLGTHPSFDFPTRTFLFFYSSRCYCFGSGRCLSHRATREFRNGRVSKSDPATYYLLKCLIAIFGGELQLCHPWKAWIWSQALKVDLYTPLRGAVLHGIFGQYLELKSESLIWWISAALLIIWTSVLLHMVDELKEMRRAIQYRRLAWEDLR